MPPDPIEINCRGPRSIPRSRRALRETCGGRKSWRSNAGRKSSAEKVAGDGTQMGQHRFLGSVGIAGEQRFQDSLVLAAIGQTALLGKGTLLHLEPGRLVAQDAHDIVYFLEELVA